MKSLIRSVVFELKYRYLYNSERTWKASKTIKVCSTNSSQKLSRAVVLVHLKNLLWAVCEVRLVIILVQDRESENFFGALLWLALVASANVNFEKVLRLAVDFRF